MNRKPLKNFEKELWILILILFVQISLPKKGFYKIADNAEILKDLQDTDFNFFCDRIFFCQIIKKCMYLFFYSRQSQ